MTPVKRLFLGVVILIAGLAAAYGYSVSRQERDYRQLIARGNAALARDDTAAAIESYVRQSHWSTESRLIFAATTAVFWMAYFAHGVFRERQLRKAKQPGEAAAPPVTIGSAAVIQQID